MALWNRKHTIVFRGSTDDDPDGVVAQANEIEVGFETLHPRVVPFGESFEDADYFLTGYRLARYDIFAKFIPVYGQAAQGDRLQTDGDYRRMTNILRMPYAWIWRVYKKGTDHGDGFFPWADEDGTDFFWHPDDDPDPGNCPML